MNTIWSYGGKLVEADNKTMTLHSPGTVQAVQADCGHVPQTQDHPQGRGRVGQYQE